MTKQVIIIRKDLKMRRGKEISQAAHGVLSFLTRRFSDSWFQSFCLTDEEKEWLQNSFKKVCVSVDSLEELNKVCENAREKGLTVHVVEDNGATEFKGVKTVTCAVIGPHYDERFVGITDGLKLY